MGVLQVLAGGVCGQAAGDDDAGGLAIDMQISLRR
jgi:hypothetical protein